MVVVGGGVAGLCAARHLHDAGLRVALFEADDELGGAARPGWLASGGDEALLEFLTDAGLRRDVFEPARAYYLARAGALCAAPRDDARPPGLVGTRLRLPRFRRVLRRMRGALRPEAPEAAARYDDRSLEALAALYLGRAAATEWLEPWLATRAPVRAESTSRVAALLALGARRGAPLYALRASPGWGDARFTRGVAVHCGRRVHAVAREGGLAVRAEGEILRPRAVVLAVPIAVASEVAAPLMSPALRRALGALGSRPVLTLRCALSNDTGLATAASGSVASLRLSRARSATLAAIAIDRERHTLRAPLREEIPDGCDPAPSPAALAAHVEELLPGLYCDAATATLERAQRPRFEVGRYRALGRARRLVAEIPDVFVAGEAWCEASLEGAAQSGRRAAREVLARLSP